MSEPVSHSSTRFVLVAPHPERAKTLALDLARALGTIEAPKIVGSVAAGLTALRTEPCDAVVALHEPDVADALVLAKALRGAGEETPVVILGRERAIDMEELAWAAGADEYACLSDTTAQQLAARLRRAVDAREQLRVTRRALVNEQLSLAREQDQAERLIASQRRLVDELVDWPGVGSTLSPVAAAIHLPTSEHYLSILRAAVVEGSADRHELSRLADVMADEAHSGAVILELHLSAVAEVVEGTSAASEAAIRQAADAVLLEAVLHLAEAYRRRYVQTVATAEEPLAARAA